MKTNVTTLASFHNQKQTNCIDFHSGGSPLGRAPELQQGIDDLLIYWSDNYHQHAITG